MARGNDGNLLQHATEAELAVGLLGLSSTRGLRLTCTHSMEPYEAFAPKPARPNQRERFDHWWQRALPNDDTPGPPVLRAYRHCRQIDRERYPNSAEIVGALIGRDQLTGTLVECENAKYERLRERWNGTQVAIKLGSWRNSLSTLTAPPSLDRPWLFTMDPFTYATGSVVDDGKFRRGDFQLLLDPVHSWLESGQPGAFTLFCYAMPSDVNDAFRAAAEDFGKSFAIPNLRVIFADVDCGGESHVGAMISRDQSLLDATREKWIGIRDVVRSRSLANNSKRISTMIHNRQDVGDRVARDIPVTAFGLDDEEFDEMYAKLEDFVNLRETKVTQTEYFVLGYERELQWVFDRYRVIGGEIFFQRGPLPSGYETWHPPTEWQPKPKK